MILNLLVKCYGKIYLHLNEFVNLRIDDLIVFIVNTIVYSKIKKCVTG